MELVEENQACPLYLVVLAAKMRHWVQTTTSSHFALLGKDFPVAIKRVVYVKRIASDLRKIEQRTDDDLRSAQIEVTQIKRVFLTGGTSFVPAVRMLFTSRFRERRVEAGNELVSIAKCAALTSPGAMLPTPSLRLPSIQE